jgi:hypothetical protein
MKHAKDIIHDLVDRNPWMFPSIENSSTTLQFQKRPKGRVGWTTYGAAYCKIVVATLPATPLSLFEK